MPAARQRADKDNFRYRLGERRALVSGAGDAKLDQDLTVLRGAGNDFSVFGAALSPAVYPQVHLSVPAERTAVSIVTAFAKDCGDEIAIRFAVLERVFLYKTSAARSEEGTPEIAAETLNPKNNRSPGIRASAYRVDCELPGVLMNAPHRWHMNMPSQALYFWG
jgi:hypothetical protein